MPLATIPEAIDAIREGKMIILVDDEDRENEGDIVIAAERVTPEAINFMAKYARGLICLSLTQERLEQLQIPLMVASNSSQFETAFTVSIEARDGVSTGISAADRAHTVLVAVDDATRPQDLVRPGHMFPLRARPGGVLVRTGQTEGSVDLSRLAGLKPASVICEILNDDGTMARMPELEVFAREHGLIIVSVADLIAYRLQTDALVELVVETPFACDYHPDFRLRVYRDIVDQGEHLAFVLGDPATHEGPVPVRVQHQCVIGDVFRSSAGDCGHQVPSAMREIAAAGCGVFVYLQSREESRMESVRKHLLDEATVRRLESDGKLTTARSVNRPRPEFRNFGIGAQIVRDCGVTRMTLLSSSQRRLVGLEAYGLEVVEQRTLTR
jgi:3,4-dihydroxy 2-butanone 4-phosphate synthase/GTP cyclohydrolase II